MHPFSVLTLGIFVAGYITARWDLVTRLYELAIFAWDNGVVVRPPCSFDSSNSGHLAQSASATLRLLPPHSTAWPSRTTAADNVPQTRAGRGFLFLTTLFLVICVPVVLLARKETALVGRRPSPLPPPLFRKPIGSRC